MSYEGLAELFQDVLDFEQQAIVLYSRIMSQTKNPHIHDILQGIIRDESVHAQNAREIIRILNEPD